MKKIFRYTPEEIVRLGKTTHDIDPEHQFSPINPKDSFLEACIRGGEKILQDPDKRQMFYRIYRGISAYKN